MIARPPHRRKLHYFKRIKDLVDNYQPDFCFTPTVISF